MASVETDAPDGRRWRGPLEKVTQQGQMVFIQELIYLDQLTYELAGILTRTRDTSFPWRLRSCTHTICPPKRDWGRQREAWGWPSPKQSPVSRRGQRQSDVTGWIVCSAQRKGCVEAISPHTLVRCRVVAQVVCQDKVRPFQNRLGSNPVWMVSLQKRRTTWTECHVTTEAELERHNCKPGAFQRWPAVTRAWKELRKGSPPAFRGTMALSRFAFRLLTSRTGRQNFCCCKTPSLWNLAMAALAGRLILYPKSPCDQLSGSEPVTFPWLSFEVLRTGRNLGLTDTENKDK